MQGVHEHVRRVVIAMVVAALAIGVVACGSSDSDAPTKAEFIKRADAVCTRDERTLQAATKRAFSKITQPSRADVNRFMNKTAIPGLRRELDELRDLKRPDGDSAAIGRIFDAVEAGIATTEQDPAEAVLGKPQPFEQANRLAGRYGLKACAKS